MCGLYKCPRCNYTVYQRCDIKKHFNRKKPCTITNEFLSEECRQKVLGIKIRKKSLEVSSFLSQKKRKNRLKTAHFCSIRSKFSFAAQNEPEKSCKKDKKSLEFYNCNNCQIF